MKKIFSVCFAFFSMFSAIASDVAKVFLLANADDTESVSLAEFYAEKRGIPVRNIIRLSLPQTQRVSADEYFSKLETPFLERLAELGALKVKRVGETGEGRAKFDLISLDAEYIILFRGVPVGILPSSKTEGLRTDAASVDSELSAVFTPNDVRHGFVKNPLYGKISEADQFKRLGILRVFRLDGATKSDVENQILQTLSAEENGLRGCAYIDKCRRDKFGDNTLQNAADILKKMGFETFVDNEPPLMGFDKRMDAAAFYFGWYSGIPRFYLSEGNFKIPAGAVAIHIFSFSARDMRRVSEWTPRFVKLGANTVGNVFEPYLQLTHNAAALTASLANKKEFGEAAYSALPAIGWQNISVADPLYRPFKHDLKEQITDIQNGRTDELSQYTVIRIMNLAEAKRGCDAAVAIGRQFLPKLKIKYALLWKLARTCEANSDLKNAIYFAKQSVNDFEYKRADLQGLAIEIANFLGDNGEGKSAMQIYTKLAQIRKDVPFAKTLLSSAKRTADKSAVALSKSLCELEAKVSKYDAERAAIKKAKEESEKRGK